MDSRFFWIISLAIIIFLGWSYISQQDKTAQNLNSESQIASTSSASAQALNAEEDFEKENIAERQITINTPNYIAVIDKRGGRLASFKLHNYSKIKTRAGQENEAMELVNQSDHKDWPLRLSLSDSSAPKLEQALFEVDPDESPLFKLINITEISIGAEHKTQLRLNYNDPNGLIVSRIFTFSGDSFLINQEVILDNSSGSIPLEGALTMRINSAPFHSKASRNIEEMGAYINNKLITDEADDASATLAKYKEKTTSLDWLGYMDQYFLTALVSRSRNETPESPLPLFSAAYQDHKGLALALTNPLSLSVGKKAVFYYDFYYGPKSGEDLSKAGHNLNKSVDLGWFSFLALPLAWLLKVIYGICGNYGVAIILVTIMIKIVLWPLTAKSYRSMKEMQKLQPKIMKLREKYKDNKEAMNREIMQLYKTFKINPLGGCLPMFLQIPFFIAFYRVLDSLLELRGAPFILWVKDLAAPDRLGSLDFTIPFFAPPTGLPVLTLLMGASMILQQKMTPNTMGDPIQAKMMMFMPLFFIFILINMPAGLVLYWLVNNVLSIAQQKLINRPEK